MGKLVAGFVLGFLACTWTYGINPTEAAFGFSSKIAAAHDHLQAEYRSERPRGHKGQYAGLHRDRGIQTVATGTPEPVESLDHRKRSWLSRAGGLPPM